jgi:O-antigen/teichoic acid export membrane protein
MSLRKKTVSGLFWTFSQQFSVQFINFIESVILARLLLPAQFGLIGMLAIFIALGNTLMDSGLTSSLIRTPNPDQKDYSTVFFINLTGSVIIYIILFFSAPFLATFYRQPVLTDIIRVYTLSFIIRAFSSVQTTRLTKEMNFRLQMTIQIPSEILGSILGIVLAYMGYGVWSLVWMNIFQTLIVTIQLWIRSGWKPDFVFDYERFKHHFHFGYKLTFANIIDTIYQNVYTIIIGRYFSATQLGYYTRASTLRQLPVQNISSALNKVTYPVFSSLQQDDVKLKSAYKKLMQQVLFWIAPTLVILIVVAEPLFRFLLTEKWLPAVPYFQILCIAGITYPLTLYNLNILKVKGRSDLFMRLSIIKKIYFTVGVFCAIPFGIYGLLYFQVIATSIGFVTNTWYSGRLINYPMREQIKDIAPILMLAAITGAIGWAQDRLLYNSLHMPDLIRIIITGTVSFFVYLSISHYSRLSSYSDFRQLILKR